jgi:hypothetical protein
MKRPRSITVIGWLFVAAGAIGLSYHATEFKAQRLIEGDFLWICFVRLVAIVCGVFLLRGSNWARWLLMVWIAYHVILSAFHSLSGWVIHTLLLAVVAYFLVRPHASLFFKRAEGGSNRRIQRL